MDYVLVPQFNASQKRAKHLVLHISLKVLKSFQWPESFVIHKAVLHSFPLWKS